MLGVVGGVGDVMMIKIFFLCGDDILVWEDSYFINISYIRVELRERFRDL